MKILLLFLSILSLPNVFIFTTNWLEFNAIPMWLVFRERYILYNGIIQVLYGYRNLRLVLINNRKNSR